MSKKRNKNARKKQLRQNRAKQIQKQEPFKKHVRLYSQLPYKVTWEPIFDGKEELSDDIKARNEVIHHNLIDSPTDFIDELIELNKQFPGTESFSNYLAAAYSYSGNKKMFKKLIHENVERFPNYLFARTQLAQYYLDEENYDKFEELIKDKLHLEQAYPERQVFHASEVSIMCYMACRYYDLHGDKEKVLFYFDIMDELNYNHHQVMQLFPIIAKYRMGDFMSNLGLN